MQQDKDSWNSCNSQTLIKVVVPSISTVPIGRVNRIVYTEAILLFLMIMNCGDKWDLTQSGMLMFLLSLKMES